MKNESRFFFCCLVGVRVRSQKKPPNVNELRSLANKNLISVSLKQALTQDGTESVWNAAVLHNQPDLEEETQQTKDPRLTGAKPTQTTARKCLSLENSAKFHSDDDEGSQSTQQTIKTTAAAAGNDSATHARTEFFPFSSASLSLGQQWNADLSNRLKFRYTTSSCAVKTKSVPFYYKQSVCGTASFRT